MTLSSLFSITRACGPIAIIGNAANNSNAANIGKRMNFTIKAIIAKIAGIKETLKCKSETKIQGNVSSSVSKPQIGKPNKYRPNDMNNSEYSSCCDDTGSGGNYFLSDSDLSFDTSLDISA